MLAKFWKKILLAICVIAILFNLTSKLVRRYSLDTQLNSVVGGQSLSEIFEEKEKAKTEKSGNYKKVKNPTKKNTDKKQEKEDEIFEDDYYSEDDEELFEEEYEEEYDDEDYIEEEF